MVDTKRIKSGTIKDFVNFPTFSINLLFVSLLQEVLACNKMTALKTQPLQPPKITFKQLHQQSLSQQRNTNPQEHNSNEPKHIMYSQTLLLDGCRSDSNPYPSDSSISLQLPSSREITPSNDSSSRYQTHVTESPDSGMESSLDHDSETWKSRENSTTILNSISSVSSKSSDMVGKSQRRGNTFEDVENFSSEIVDLRHPNSVETENGNQEVNNSISDDNSSPGNESDTIAPSSPVLVNNSYSMYAHRSPKRKLSSVGPEESPSPVSRYFFNILRKNSGKKAISTFLLLIKLLVSF